MEQEVLYLRNENRLVLTVNQHVAVGIVSHREDMWWSFIPSLALVRFYNLWGVDREPLVRVDGHTEESRVGLQ